ncbi:DUF2267 domain-containing protein [Halococcus sediminicola]|uniref:DUF2267 domain-containing protein n=1 Tax=Halococcus sediminicola TaxID=1264579 RepID=UPI0009AE284E|nr:DUF2267 domain-containing protein [Halococcus sediminicola]
MDQDEFLDVVQRRAQVNSRDEAYTIAHATLSVLGQRIGQNEAETIASQLPETFANTLTSENETTEEFSANEFSERVHRRQIKEEHFSVPPTDRHVRAVIEVVGIITGNTVDDLRNQLSADFESLFEPVNNDTHHSDELTG